RTNLAFPIKNRPGPAAVSRVETEWPRMTVDALKLCNKKALARMAKDQGVAGWHAMSKDQLIRALTPTARAARKEKDKDGARAKSASQTAATAMAPARASRQVVPVKDRPLAPMPAPPRALGHDCGK